MNTFMWDSPFTAAHLEALQRLGVSIIPPVRLLLFMSAMLQSVCMCALVSLLFMLLLRADQGQTGSTIAAGCHAPCTGTLLA